MKLFGHEIRLRLSKKRDAERLAAIRALNTRWRYIPYGEEVQVRHANPESDLEVGMVGTVLTKEENKELSTIDAERYSNALKSKPLIKECG